MVKTYPSHNNTHTRQCELHLETLDTSSGLHEASRHILVNEERLVPPTRQKRTVKGCKASEARNDNDVRAALS